jgi:hypothetical protein
MKSLLHFLLWIWQAPQNILGFLLKIFLEDQECIYYPPENEVAEDDEFLFFSVCHRIKRMGVSLGFYSILGWQTAKDKKAVRHEVIGHVKQSKRWGPLYLPVVGLSSLCRNIYGRIMKKDAKWYFGGWPENEADKLAGIARSY